MRVVFFGSGAFARPTLEWLVQSTHEIPLVVTQPARGSGRGRRLTRTPVRALADELGVASADADDVNSPTFVEMLRSQRATLGLVIAFGQKLGPELLGSLPWGCINLHASLLPRLRGAAPINWAILRGEERTGCTVFRIGERMDAGPILVSRWTTIKPEETAGELHDRLAGIGVDAVRAALDLCGDNTMPAGTPQDESKATRAPKLKKADGLIDFHGPALAVARHICGMTPWPGAATRFVAADGRWEDVSIIRARRAEDPTRPQLPPGTLDDRLYVAAGDGYVELLEVKPSSGRVMTWPDYVNGRHVRKGDTFVVPPLHED